MNDMNIDSVDLNLLKVLQALHEEGTAGRAAIRLGVTQSAVSAALGRLRALYGDPLFERTGRGLRPTPKAEELRPLIADALQKLRQSLALAQPGGASLAGRTVVLGLSDDHEMALGRRLIDRLQQAAPGLRLVLRQTHSGLAADMLMDRRIDLSLGAGTGSSRTLTRQVLGTGRYACVMDLAQAPPGHLGLDEYLRRPHLLISSGGFVGVVDEALAALGHSRRIEASTTHFAALPHLLRGSTALATLPEHAARALAALGTLVCVPCPIELPRYAIELAWRSGSLRDPAVECLKLQVEAAVASFASSV